MHLLQKNEKANLNRLEEKVRVGIEQTAEQNNEAIFPVVVQEKLMHGIEGFCGTAKTIQQGYCGHDGTFYINY